MLLTPILQQTNATADNATAAAAPRLVGISGIIFKWTEVRLGFVS